MPRLRPRLIRARAVGALAVLAGAVTLAGCADRTAKPSLEASARSVVVNWAAEEGWSRVQRLEREWGSGRRVVGVEWTTVHEVDTPGEHSWTDGDAGSDVLHCYRIMAESKLRSWSACTVRPDDRYFPQDAPDPARQWRATSAVNGKLYNSESSDALGKGGQPFGVNLKWGDHSSNLTLRRYPGAGAGLCGEPMAIGISSGAADGGGIHGDRTWLRHEKRFVGVDLRLSETPRYEWRLICDDPGIEIDNQWAGLWNAKTEKFLVYDTDRPPYQVDLGWHDPDPDDPDDPEQTLTVFLELQSILSDVVTYAGGIGPIVDATLTAVASPPINSHTLAFVQQGHTTTECADLSAVVVLAPGQAMSASDRESVFGTTQPALWPDRVDFIACVNVSPQGAPSQLPINVTYTKDT